MNDLNLEIRGFGRINDATIGINRINVVGGVNASGKSTASKLLYCFLKANSHDRDRYILPKIIPRLNALIAYVDHPNEDYYRFIGKLELGADKSEVLNVYKEYKDKINELEKSSNQNLRRDLYLESTIALIDALETDDNILSSYCLSYLMFDEYLINFAYEEPVSGLHFLNGNIKFYSDSFESIIHDDVKVDVDDSGEVIDVTSDSDFDCEGDDFYYLTKGSIKKVRDVFYIGSMSIFDLESYINSPNFRDEELPFSYEEHMEYLINNLNVTNDKIHVPENIIKILKKIEKIIEGTFQNNYPLEFSFSQDEKDDIIPVNISSGIKQIGILQLLLLRNKLVPGSFLIMDEPEVNLHPDWQFKLAEILVLLAKELDITVYLNSHSPMFIESINAFSEYYDMLDDVNYYLTEESEVEGMYNFTKIPPNKLYKVYNNLGNVYDLIDEIRLKKYLGE